MERKTAVAAATAISMSLAAATIAIGANLGALGFARSPATVAQPSAVSVTAAQPAGSGASLSRGEVGERESTTRGAAVTTPAAREKGHRSDD